MFAMSLATATSMALPILENAPQRPAFAQGPRTLSSVKLLRLSVTDRCNLRCVYCMPADGVEFHEKDDLLTPRDFEAVARAAVRVGVTHLKITGGEPTIRRDILEIVSRLAALGPTDLSMTTNGMQMHRLAAPLRDAGVMRLTVSCDSLRDDRFQRITSGGRLEQFWRGIDAAMDAGFQKLKVNVVVMAGINDDEVGDFAALTIDRPWTVRFIEYMPLGDSVMTLGGRPQDHIVDNELVRSRIESRFGPLLPVIRASEPGVGPARVFRIEGAAGRLGFISAMSRPFCETCNRLRLTAMGELRSCLFDGGEVSVLPALRPITDERAIIDLMARCVALKPDVHSSRGNRAMSQLGG
jgi:cyclic pyranopterin phosphate synthase